MNEKVNCSYLYNIGCFVQYNGTKFISLNSYPECEWAKCPCQKTQGIRMDKKNKTHLYVASKKHILSLKTPPDLK